MLGDGADAAQAPRVLVRHQPIGPRRPALGQNALEVLEPPRDEVVDNREADPGARRLELGDGVRALEAN